LSSRFVQNPATAPNAFAYGLNADRRKSPNMGEFVELLNKKNNDNIVFFAN
jgi:hypothetical protein